MKSNRNNILDLIYHSSYLLPSFFSFTPKSDSRKKATVVFIPSLTTHNQMKNHVFQEEV